MSEEWLDLLEGSSNAVHVSESQLGRSHHLLD